MASGEHTLTISINVNTRSALSQLSGLKTALSDLINSGSKDSLGAAMRASEQAALKAAAAVRQTNVEAQKLKETAEQVAAAMQRWQSRNPVASTNPFQPLLTEGEKIAGLLPTWSSYWDRFSRTAQDFASGFAPKAIALGRGFVDLRDSAYGFTQAGERIAGLLPSMTSSTGDLSHVFGEGATQGSAFQRVVAGLRKGFEDGKGAVVNHRDAMMQLNNTVTEAQKKIDELTSGMDKSRREAYAWTIAGYQMKAAGDAVLGVLSATAKTFTDYDFNLRRAAGSFEVFDDKSKLFSNLSDSIQQLGIDTKLLDPTDIAKGMYFWGSATGEVIKNNEDLANTIKNKVLPVMQTAAMTEVDQETAIKGVTGVMQEFRLGSDKTADTVEKMFYAAQKSSMEFGDLVTALRYVGPVAAQNNVSFEETVNVLGAMADAGIRGSKAGMTFRSEFSQLLAPTDKATKALDGLVSNTLGLSDTWQHFIFPDGKFIGIEKIINTLATSMNGLTDQQKNYLLQVITTNAELPGFYQELVQQNDALAHGTSIFKDQFNLNDAAANFAANWKLIGDSARATFGEMTNRIKPLILLIGSDLVEAAKPVAKIIGDIATSVTPVREGEPGALRYGRPIRRDVWRGYRPRRDDPARRRSRQAPRGLGPAVAADRDSEAPDGSRQGHHRPRGQHGRRGRQRGGPQQAPCPHGAPVHHRRKAEGVLGRSRGRGRTRPEHGELPEDRRQRGREVRLRVGPHLRRPR
jgi:TP901 family phage tail tape measure protein